MLSNEQKAVIEKVQKLLALANGNANEHEAEAATAKAMDLLAAYNLSMHQVGTKQPDGKREDKKRKGGLYGWQRDLWKHVAELNFCMYWSIKGLTAGSTYEHRVLGSEVNVVSTEVMADYLQATVERLAQKWAKENGLKSVFVREAIAYREGMAHGLVGRLNAMRRKREREEQEARDARGTGDGKAVILADVVTSEADLNNDYINGWEPGRTSRERAERAAKQAEAYARYQEREAEEKAKREADPEYAAKMAEKEKADKDYWDELVAKSQRKAEAAERRRMKNAGKEGYDDLGYKIQYRRETAQEQRMGLRSFGEGVVKAQSISLDKQVDKDAERKVLE